MSWLDWVVVLLYFAIVLLIGFVKGRRAHELEDYFLAKRSMSWWVVGLSVMATQASAITLIGGTGQGCATGMSFIQFYFGLPFAMVILCATVVPFFHRANVYTAYEYLERRFGPATRSLTSAIFLISRALSDSIVLYAPAVVLSVLLKFDERAMILITGVTCVTYTVLGGMRAVMWTEVFQMIMIFVGIVGCLVAVMVALPDSVAWGGAMEIAAAAGRLEAVSFSPDPTKTYTVWTGLFGGLFLMLSYFGCDQSQVQRYLTARSVGQARLSLLFNAFAKLPLQCLILLTGVLLYVFFVFQEPPVNFQPAALASARASAQGDELREREGDFHRAFEARRESAEQLLARPDRERRLAFQAAEAEALRTRAAANEVIQQAQGGRPVEDVNYIFPSFVIRFLPAGLLGLLLVAIFAAAMSTVESELNSLATATVIDFYRRYRPGRDERHYVIVSKISTALWGAFATVMALNLGHLGSAIETVNKIGSHFYGPILGVFAVAFCTRISRDRNVCAGLLIGLASVFLLSRTGVSFLWYNLIGCLATVAGAWVATKVSPSSSRPASP
jgi:Na+/proline symporter